MRDFIEAQIAARRAKLQDIDRQRLTVDAELRTFEEMLEHLGVSIEHPRVNGVHPVPDRGASSVPAEITPGWRKILCGLEKLGRTFTAADIVTIGEDAGQTTKMSNARSQIYQWERKHIISRVRKGKYRLAAKGTELAQKAEDSDIHTSEPSL